MAVFIIRRKLEQREFAATSIADLFNSKGGFLFYQPSLNIMKLIEMYFFTDPVSGKNFHKHWLDMTTRSMKDNRKIILPQQFFVWIENKRQILDKTLGNNNVNKLCYLASNPLDFVDFIKDHLLNDTNDENTSKYESWFSDNPIQYSSKEYLIFYKYIALCLSGQLDPETDNFHSCQQKIRTTDVDYQIDYFSNKNLIVDIIYKCIKNILWQ